MADHLYGVGSLVYLQYSDGNAMPKSRTYTVEAQMPPVGTSFQYRIKSEDEAFRRVVPEHQVSALSDIMATPASPMPVASGEQD